jgi:hypothetical protein
MPMPVPRDHPLRRLLCELTERNFAAHLGWADPETIRYIADLLADFVHVDHLYRIRDAQGRRVEEVAEMLLEGDLLHRASSVERERAVHKHIGDFTLFMGGLFPEWVRRLTPSRIVASADAFLDFVQVGKRSYRIVAEFQHGAYAEAAPLFRKLAEHFELCLFGLGCVRADLDRLRDPRFQTVKGRLLGETAA